jgi:hypothetical protein
MTLYWLCTSIHQHLVQVLIMKISSLSAGFEVFMVVTVQTMTSRLYAV